MSRGSIESKTEKVANKNKEAENLNTSFERQKADYEKSKDNLQKNLSEISKSIDDAFITLDAKNADLKEKIDNNEDKYNNAKNKDEKKLDRIANKAQREFEKNQKTYTKLEKDRNNLKNEIFDDNNELEKDLTINKLEKYKDKLGNIGDALNIKNIRKKLEQETLKKIDIAATTPPKTQEELDQLTKNLLLVTESKDLKTKETAKNSLDTLLKQTLNNFNNGKFDLAGIAQVFTELFKNSGFKSFLAEFSAVFGTQNIIEEKFKKLEQGLSDNELNKSFIDIQGPKDRDDINKGYLDGEKSANASTGYDKYKVEEIGVGQINNVDYKFKLIGKYSGNNVDTSINSLQKDSAVQIGMNDPSGDNWKVTDAGLDGTIKLERPKTKTTKSVYEGKEGYKIETKDGKKTETLTFTIKNFKEIKQKDAIDGSKIFTDTKNKDQVTVNEQLKTFNPNLYVEQFNKIHTTEPKLTLEKLKENKTREAIKQAIDEKLRITTKESFLNALTTLLLTDKLGKYYPTQEIPKT